MNTWLRGFLLAGLVSVGTLRPSAAVTITSFSPTFGAAGDPNPVTIYGSGFTGGLPVIVKFDGPNGKATNLNYVASSDHFTVFIPAGTTLGSNHIYVQVGSNPQNSVQSLDYFTVIGPGPYVTSISPLSGSSGIPVTIQGAHLLNTTVTIGGKAAPQQTASETMLTVTAPNNATSGPIVLSSTAGKFTNSAPFLYPPILKSFSPAAGRPGTNIVITGTNLFGVTTVEFKVYGGGTVDVPVTGSNTNNNTNYVTVPPNAITGPLTVFYPAGGQPMSGQFTVQPNLISFSPTSGAAGTSVTITGANFLPGTPTVNFTGSGAVTPTGVTFNQMTAAVPANATTGPLTVNTTNGNVTSTAKFYVPPTITSFTPTNGTAGTWIKISGNNFTDASAVSFNGVAATTFTVTNNTTLGVQVPAGVVTGPITVTTPGGTATSTGSFYSAPTISSFSPTHGPVGTRLQITGNNFTGATAIQFANAAATAFVVSNNTTLGVTVPSYAQSGTISLTTPGGTAISPNTFTVDYTSDLSVSMTVSTNQVAVTTNLIFTISVLNQGPDQAANVLFTNTLPDQVIVTSVTPSGLSQNGNILSGNLGTIGYGSAQTVTLTLAPQSGGWLTNTAAVGSSSTDPISTNNTASATALVMPKLRAFNTRTNTVIIGWPAPSTGFSLQHNPTLRTNNWVAVTNVPATAYVTNAVTTNENQVVLKTRIATNDFFRLKLAQ